MELTKEQIRNLQSFVEALKINPDVIKKVLDTESDVEVNILDLAKSVMDDKRELFLETARKELDKEIGDKHVKGYELKVRKDLVKQFGLDLTNKQIEEVKNQKDFYALFKTNIDEKISDLTTDAEKTLKADVDRLLESNRKLQENFEKEKADFEVKLAAKDSEVHTQLRQIKVRGYFDKIVSKDVSEEKCINDQFKIEVLRDRALSSLKIDNDGNISNIDGTLVRHPDKDYAIKSIDDWWDVQKQIAGLVPKSQAGVLPSTIGGNSVPIADNAKAAEIERRLAEKYSKIKAM